ncbi:MAG: TetR/AcrR family transcriptional regulator [Acidobacteriota bacterium]
MLQNSELSQLSRKEREKKSRQDEILNAARILFSQKGYHNTTLEEIAHKAEFAKGTIYNYFANKDELFFGIMNSVIDEMHAAAQEAFQTGPDDLRERFTRFAHRLIAYAVEHRDLFRTLMQEGLRTLSDNMNEWLQQMSRKEEEFRAGIVRVLKQEIEQGRMRPIDPYDAALMFEGMVRMYCMHFAKRLQERPSDEEVRQAAERTVSIFYDGISQQNTKEES